jgi:hypothetical protein
MQVDVLRERPPGGINNIPAKNAGNKRNGGRNG